jgi:DNA-binding TFAR19-related protein (PDSD5 family)
MKSEEIYMSDRELENLRRKKMSKFKNLVQKKMKNETKRENIGVAKKEETKSEILNRFLFGRAWEVLNAARAQNPQATDRFEKMLITLIKEKKIVKKISGKELYLFFRSLGLKVRLKTQIRIIEHGKTKTLVDKLKDDN